jgi:hypothetical protein
MRRADHSSRGVIPTVLRRCVWSTNLVNEEALAHWGLLCQKKEKKITTHTEHNQKGCQADSFMLCHRYWLLECDTTYVPMFQSNLLLPSSMEMTEWAGSFQMLIHIYHPSPSQAWEPQSCHTRKQSYVFKRYNLRVWVESQDEDRNTNWSLKDRSSIQGRRPWVLDDLLLPMENRSAWFLAASSPLYGTVLNSSLGVSC